MEKTNGKISKNTVCWHAVYTAPKAEEKAKRKLEQSGFECYLPLQSVTRTWNGHKKRGMIPIIPRIFFVCLSIDEVLKITTLEGVSLLVKQEGCYVSVSGEQLKSFQDQIGRTDGVIDFIFDNSLMTNQHTLIDIEGLGKAILRK